MKVYRRSDLGLSTSATAMVFTEASLEAATGGFCPASLIAEGGFGAVYRGKLPETRETFPYGGREVAIKVLKLERIARDAAEAKRGGDGTPKQYSGTAQFAMEAKVLGKYRHPNVVALLGSTMLRLKTGKERSKQKRTLQPCLVYEFLAGQSLELRLRLWNV